MNGAGNRFILLDARHDELPFSTNADAIRRLAREHLVDQILWLEADAGADARMRIWNGDGDEVGACGNGTRAAAWHMIRGGLADTVHIATLGGLLEAHAVGDFRIGVNMGRPRLEWRQIPLAREMDTIEMAYSAIAAGVRIGAPGAVNMGNPHVVFFVPDVESMPLDRLGPEVELDPLFPERTNVGFAQVYDRSHIRLRVWERGAGLTAACGTGACAALVAAHRRGLVGRQASIQADGGELEVEWRIDDQVILTGPVEDEGEIVLGQSR
ncbi:diaminopimelate epimerase [Maricaulis sp. CAU 1757]